MASVKIAAAAALAASFFAAPLAANAQTVTESELQMALHRQMVQSAVQQGLQTQREQQQAAMQTQQQLMNIRMQTNLHQQFTDLQRLQIQQQLQLIEAEVRELNARKPKPPHTP